MESPTLRCASCEMAQGRVEIEGSRVRLSVPAPSNIGALRTTRRSRVHYIILQIYRDYKGKLLQAGSLAVEGASK